jgi:hypothetical protein
MKERIGEARLALKMSLAPQLDFPHFVGAG